MYQGQCQKCTPKETCQKCTPKETCKDCVAFYYQKCLLYPNKDYRSKESNKLNNYKYRCLLRYNQSGYF